MRIAIATENKAVCQHFEIVLNTQYTRLKGSRYAKKRLFQTLAINRISLATYMTGVDVIIAGGMGVKAQKVFAEAGINAILGIAGPTEQVAKQDVEKHCKKA